MAKAKQKDSTIQSKAAPKIIDVARPNDTAPSANSKSVIIKHQPMMRDPMMAAPTPEVAVEVVPDAAAEPATVRHEKIIMPEAAEPAAQVAPAAEKVDEPVAAETVSDESFTVSESIPAEDSPGYTSQKSPQAAEVDAETEVDERHKVLDDLVEKQTFFLPINTTGQQKKKQYIALSVFLAIILGLAWLNVALDAGLIQIPGIEAPTDFFKN